MYWAIPVNEDTPLWKIIVTVLRVIIKWVFNSIHGGGVEDELISHEEYY